MDNKKFEQLIDLIINEDEDKARALFHDIVVEKSREIYESMMADEMMGSPVEGLLDEISAEEEGMTEEEDDLDIEVDDMGDEEGEIDLDSDEMDDMGDEEGDLENRVVDLEDKLDELMAEFEELMGQEDGEEENNFGDEDMGDDDMGTDEMMEASHDDEDDDEDAEDALEESVQLKKVSVTHGDNGQNTKSPVSSGPKVSGNGASAANLNKGGDGGKGGTQGGLLNPSTKDLPGAGSFKNSPGKDNFSDKGEAAPKPKHGDDGQNSKSPVAESKKSVKKIIKK